MFRLVAALCLILRCLSPAFGAAEQAALALVEEGRATAVIILPVPAPGTFHDVRPVVQRQVAATLSGHIEQMTGARLPIVSEDAYPQTVVVDGRIVPPAGAPSAQTYILVGQGTLAKALSTDHTGLEPGGIRIRTVGNALIILGHPEISHPTSDGGGLRRAAATFLESLGVRYLWPGETGKVVPAMRTILVPPTDIAYNPVIRQRNIRSIGAQPAGLAGLQVTAKQSQQALDVVKRTVADELAVATGLSGGGDLGWQQWHGMGGHIGISGGHAFGDAWEKWGTQHPEWFALQVDGTRDQTGSGSRERLCVSNPDLIQAIADDVIAHAEANPRLICISICPNDGGYSSFCLCDACAALDAPGAPQISMLVFDKVGQPHRKKVEHVSLTDRYVYFWNQIAERVAASKPNLLLLTQAYSYYSHPPVREKLHPNLVVRFVPSDITGWAGWQAAGAKRVYWRPNILLQGSAKGLVVNYARQLADSISLLADKGMVATDFDAITHHWATAGLNYYVTARLLWNPELSYEQILHDYCERGFGAGATMIEEYFELAAAIDRHTGYTAETIAELRSLLAGAEQAAAGDEASCARIAFLRIGLNHTDLHVTLDRLATAGPGNRDIAQPLLRLYHFASRSIALAHPMAVNVSWVRVRTGAQAAWENIGGRGYQAPAALVRQIDGGGSMAPAATGLEAEMLDLVTEPARPKHLTGRENSFGAIREALGLDAAGDGATSPAGTAEEPSPQTIMQTDEHGEAFELPVE